MLGQLSKVIWRYPKFKVDMLETIKSSEVNLHRYLQMMFGKGYTKNFRKEKLVRTDVEIGSICKIATDAGPLAHGSLFCGAPGCGKTMTMLQVAHLIGHSLLEKHLAKAFDEGSMMPLEDTWFKSKMKLFCMNQLDNDMVKACKGDTPFIFLDDLVFVGLTDTRRQMLESIIESCCRNNAILFGTTNMHPDDLEQKPEMQRVYSRLNLKCKFLIFENIDYRLGKNEKNRC